MPIFIRIHMEKTVMSLLEVPSGAARPKMGRLKNGHHCSSFYTRSQRPLMAGTSRKKRLVYWGLRMLDLTSARLVGHMIQCRKIGRW